MADQKLTALTAVTSASTDDLLYIVDDPGGSPLSRKITFDNAQKSLTQVGKVVVTQPATASTLTIVNGATLTASATADVSGTNTGDQLTFKTIAVSGQSDIVADGLADTLTIVAGTGITLTTNAGTDTLTITNSSSGTGDVVGPGSATDNAFARFDGTTGKLIQNSVVIGDDTGNVTGIVAQTNTGLLTVTKAGVPLDVQNSTDAASNQMAIFRAGDRATPAALDEGYISFYLDGSAGSHVEFGRLTVVATTITTASRASEIIIGPYFNGSATARAGFGVDYFAPLTAFSTQYDLGSTTRLFRNLYLMESAQIVCGNNLAAIQFNDTVIGVSGANFSAPNVQINNGGGLRPTTTSGHAMHIQIYDTDLGDYVNAASTINANSPNLDFKEAYVTMNSNVIYRVAGQDVAVTDGGTGASTAAGARTNLGVPDGTWTPVRSAEANITGTVTMFQGQYLQVGSTVVFSGRFTATPTLTATATSFEMTLPVASNFGAVEDCAGTAFCGAVSGMGAMIEGSVANNTMVVKWVASDINSQSWSFSGSYQVI